MELFTLEQLTSLCEKHDWFFSFSDDHQVWKKGCAESDRIKEVMFGLQQQGMGQQAKQIYNNWRPEGLNFG